MQSKNRYSFTLYKIEIIEELKKLIAGHENKKLLLISNRNRLLIIFKANAMDHHNHGRFNLNKASLFRLEP